MTLLGVPAPPAGVTAGTCPVCRSAGVLPFGCFDAREYWRCPTCGARFLDPRHRLSRDAEFRHYLHHENDPGDPGYRRFLARLAEPLAARLPLRASGLDYGCGPGPALAAMLREAGHEVALWDPFFHPGPAPLHRSYDFVTCTETAEHFHEPADEFDRLGRLLKAGGWLGVMTCFQTEDGRFADWHYRKDPTHVVFYREETMRHIAASRGWSCEIPCKDIALMRNPEVPRPDDPAASGGPRSPRPGDMSPLSRTCAGRR